MYTYKIQALIVLLVACSTVLAAPRSNKAEAVADLIDLGNAAENLVDDMNEMRENSVAKRDVSAAQKVQALSDVIKYEQAAEKLLDNIKEAQQSDGHEKRSIDIDESKLERKRRFPWSAIAKGLASVGKDAYKWIKKVYFS